MYKRANEREKIENPSAGRPLLGRAKIFFSLCSPKIIQKTKRGRPVNNSPFTNLLDQFVKRKEKKSRIRETLNLSTDADSSTDAIGGWTKNTPKPASYQYNRLISQYNRLMSLYNRLAETGP